jgi:uncharacterized protein YjbI with pentapeptide repeats
MANPEHLEILKQGVKVWNEWRERSYDIIIDLSGVDLSDTNLSNADLSDLDFSGADLSRTVLSDAVLSMTDLSRTDLSFADLSNADISGGDLTYSDFSNSDLSGSNLSFSKLSGVNLSNADLSGADLSEADLQRANLNAANLSKVILSQTNCSYADLTGANLSYSGLEYDVFLRAKLNCTDVSYAQISWTIFADVDLSNVIGLDSLVHFGPSSVGIDTIYKSKRNIPEVFLRGCGLPDEFIAYIPSLIGKGIEYYSCFISYSHRDEDFAKRLHNDLQAKGVRCWFAPHDMKIGDKIRPIVDDSIRLHDKLLLILSEHSVQSNWVEHEVEHALDLETERKKTVLFPVRIDEAIMESKTGWAGNVKRQRHMGDFTKWKQHDTYQAAFDRLLRDLKAG